MSNSLQQERKSAGPELIALFREPGTRADKIYKAYDLIHAATPSSASGTVLLQHAATLITAAERAAYSPEHEHEPAARPDVVTRAQPEQADGDSDSRSTTLDSLIDRARVLHAAAVEAIERGRRA